MLEAIAPGRIDLGRRPRARLRPPDRDRAQSVRQCRGRVSAAGARPACAGSRARRCRKAIRFARSARIRRAPTQARDLDPRQLRLWRAARRALRSAVRLRVLFQRRARRRGSAASVSHALPAERRSSRRPRRRSASGRWPPTPKTKRAGCCTRASIGASDSSRGCAARCCRRTKRPRNRIRRRSRRSSKRCGAKAIVGTAEQVATRLRELAQRLALDELVDRDVDLRPRAAPALVRAAGVRVRACAALGIQSLRAASRCASAMARARPRGNQTRPAAKHRAKQHDAPTPSADADAGRRSRARRPRGSRLPFAASGWRIGRAGAISATCARGLAPAMIARRRSDARSRIRHDRRKIAVASVAPSHAERIEPMTAKPSVEPIARCALMMPDAMPARCGGTLVMASDVIGVRHSAKPNPAMRKPGRRRTPDGARCPRSARRAPAIMIDEPEANRHHRADSVRPWRPASGEATSIARLNGSRKSPVSTGVNPRTFCRYCVVSEQHPVEREERDADGDDGQRIRAVAKQREVHHRVGAFDSRRRTNATNAAAAIAKQARR